MNPSDDFLPSAEDSPGIDRERFERHLTRQEYYPYPGPPGYDVLSDRTRGRLRETVVSFMSPLPSGVPSNDTVLLRSFAPQQGRTERAVVFVHGFGFARLRSWDSLPRALASRGFPSVSLSLPYLCERAPAGDRPGRAYMSTDATVALPAYEQAVADVRGALDWLLRARAAQQEESNRHAGAAIIGVSLGAMISVIAAALEPRFAALVPMLGGGDLDVIVFRGGYPTPVRAELDRARITRENRRRAQIMYHEHLEAVRRASHPLSVRPALHYYLFDPLTYASHLRTKPILMVNALFDPIIPRAAVRQLWLELGCPEISWLWGTHWVGGPWHPFVLRRIVGFLRGVGASAPRTPPDTHAVPPV